MVSTWRRTRPIDCWPFEASGAFLAGELGLEFRELGFHYRMLFQVVIEGLIGGLIEEKTVELEDRKYVVRTRNAKAVLHRHSTVHDRSAPPLTNDKFLKFSDAGNDLRPDLAVQSNRRFAVAAHLRQFLEQFGVLIEELAQKQLDELNVSDSLVVGSIPNRGLVHVHGR